MKLLAMAGSLRKESVNKRLVEAAARIAAAEGAEVEVVTLNDYPLPLYNQDIQDGEGMPEAAIAFKSKLDGVDGMLLASPEYNYSIPGGLKNWLDWMSRFRPKNALADKRILLLGASPGGVGGHRGLIALQTPLLGIGSHVHPALYTLPFAHEQFNEAGDLKEAPRHDRLVSTIKGFLAQGPVKL